MESSKWQCRIFSLSSLRFWHIPRIVILIISPDVKIIVSALNLVTTLIRMRKRRYVKIGAKTLRSNFGMKATANEMDVATIRMA